MSSVCWKWEARLPHRAHMVLCMMGREAGLGRWSQREHMRGCIGGATKMPALRKGRAPSGKPPCPAIGLVRVAA